MALPSNNTVAEQKTSGTTKEPRLSPLHKISRARLFFYRVLIAVLGIVLALVLIEVAFRVVHPFFKSQEAASDRPKRYYYAEGHPEGPQLVSLPKPPGVFRILVLGDSFTFGQGLEIEDAYPARLERWLNLNKDGRKVEVLNWGVRGYSTVQELELYKKGLQLVSPDLVILQITLNDPEAQPYRVTHPWLNAHGEVVLTSPVFQLWKSLGFAVERILNHKTRSEYVDYYYNLFENHQTWIPFQGALTNFGITAKEQHVPLFAMIFPLFSHPFNESYPFKPLHEKVNTLLSTLDIPHVDLLKSFADMSPMRLQIEPGHDSHPNEIAHRIAAERLFRALRKRELIPAENIPKFIKKER